MSGSSIMRAAQEGANQTLEMLEALVRLESPTSEKAAVDNLVSYVEQAAIERGAAVDRMAQRDFGDLLVARWSGNAEIQPLFVMTHVDTVWPIGTLERLPWRREDGAIFGPGIYDMKASVAMMLSAIDVRADLDIAHRPIFWLVNTEEEVGSPVSRPVLERLAGEAAYVLCLEPPVPPHGALKTQRKGVGMFTMRVTGRASHAGADYSAGISAIEELARQIQWLHSLSDIEKGTTVNVGVVRGGTKRNVVAAQAEAEIDLRVTTMAEAERVVPRILAAQAQLAGASVEVTGGLNRPPMERTEVVVAAFERAKEIGRGIGLQLQEGSTGGGSDGNFTAALEVPTIDGLGCPGDGAHAENEHIIEAELPKRVALLTALLSEL